MARGRGSPHDARRALLQLLISRKVMTKPELEAGLAKICEDMNVNATMDVKASLSELNKELQLSHLQIRGLIKGGVETYGIVNMMSDEIAKAHASKIKEWEKAFFKEVIKTLCESQDEGVEKLELTNLRAAQGGTAASIREKEGALFTLEAEFWLRKDKHARYFLGPRTFLELGDFVTAHGMELPQVIHL